MADFPLLVVVILNALIITVMMTNSPINTFNTYTSSTFSNSDAKNTITNITSQKCKNNFEEDDNSSLCSPERQVHDESNITTQLSDPPEFTSRNNNEISSCQETGNLCETVTYIVSSILALIIILQTITILYLTLRKLVSKKSGRTPYHHNITNNDIDSVCWITNSNERHNTPIYKETPFQGMTTENSKLNISNTSINTIYENFISPV